MPTRSHSFDAHLVLSAVLARAQQLGDRGLVAFDLDSTLLDNRPRQAKILRAFGAHIGDPRLLRALPIHIDGWDPAIALRKLGVPEMEHPTLLEAYKPFWRERFFTSEACLDDVAIPGAASFLNTLALTTVKIAYVTGRHEGMRPGTIASLRREEMPVQGTHLIMKPRFEIADDEWKITAQEQLRGLGELVAIFDNEPAHVNGYVASFGPERVVHLDTDHSGRPIEVAKGVPSISNFMAVVN